MSGSLDPAAARRLAVELFNRAWELLELPGRTPEQEDELIHAAHAWDLPFAHEALARAHAVAGDETSALRWLERAREALPRIADPEDRELLEAALATIPVQATSDRRRRLSSEPRPG